MAHTGLAVVRFRNDWCVVENIARKSVLYPVPHAIAQILIREGVPIARESDGATHRKRTAHSGVKILNLRRRHGASLVARWLEAGHSKQVSLTAIGIRDYEAASLWAVKKAGELLARANRS